ncbi:MAG: DEAD/DEAH box helicase [Fibrobacteraceae bacterium]|nr:DEAD/DEAH box helicase [Fibrobacteraceae bacterium]
MSKKKEGTIESADLENQLDEALVTFEDLGLSEPVLEAIKKLGYETPTPIQAKAIPALLQGENLLGTAQTGTGKTAAFTLPLLSRLEFNGHETSMLVLTPTRELAIQVAEAVEQYSVNLSKVHVVAVYGGQDIQIQLRAMKRKANIIVATPGRLIDHVKRGSVDLSGVKAIVIDEADEMLDMGFMEDMETILKEIPSNAQRALFSATMPKEVKKIIDQHLGEYAEACIQGKTTTVENIRQRFVVVRSEHKLEALTRVIEGEDFDGMLIFVRTKQNTSELAEKLESRGFNVAPLSGDLAQAMRERTINRLKMGKLDIVVATDVAARGIDVDRITHVVNYDIPYDTESYVHRIGRTGRAGRSGNAILFITPRENRMLKTIERATRQPIEPMDIPTGETISKKRVAAFKQKIEQIVEAGDLDDFKNLVLEIAAEKNLDPIDIAAAAIKKSQAKFQLFPVMEKLDATRNGREDREKRESRRSKDKFEDDNSFGLNSEEKKRMRKERKEGLNGVEEGFLRYYLGVGRIDHVTPRDIVGAIASEANISSSIIGRIKLFDKFSTVELPEDTDQNVLEILSGITIRGNDARFRLMTDEPPAAGTGRRSSRKDSKKFEGRREFHKDSDNRKNKGRHDFAKKSRGGFRGERRFGRH